MDLVLLVMDNSASTNCFRNKVSLGADASLAAGPVGCSVAQMNAEMLVYSRSHGLFAGIDISGGVLRPDKEADAAYGADVKARDIIERNQHPTIPVAARAFITALGRDVVLRQVGNRVVCLAALQSGRLT